MFARRRSFSSLDKLPCLNTAFLTCCLLLIGHVSSMSLDRPRREYQQQNDKQLELSDLMLPEAESEMLQNDMELVSADDGNSDMYLLVPASAVSQQQNLQTLTDLNESQNSGNVESNSDMLMQESEDAPAVQVLVLPENELKSQIREELVANNELDQETHSANENQEEALNNVGQVSGSTLNNIAAAAQEIETELVGSDPSTQIKELIQTENAKQAETLIGDEDGEADTAAVSDQEERNSEKSAEATHEMEKIHEDLQLDLQSEDSDIQAAAADFTQQSLEQLDESSDSNESFPAMELTEVIDANDVSDANQTIKESQISNDGEPIKISESETANEFENKQANENLENHDEHEIRKDIVLQAIKENSEETLDVEKDEVVEETQAAKDKANEDSVEEQLIDEEIKTLPEEPSVGGNETEVKIELSEADEIGSADESQAVEETQAKDIEEENKPFSDESSSDIKENDDEVQTIPTEILSAGHDVHSVLEGESLAELQAIGENQNVENIQPSEEIENSEELSTDEKRPAKENQLNREIQNAGASSVLTSNEEGDKDQLSLQSQIIAEINKQIADKESHMSESNAEDEVQTSNEDEKIQQLQSDEEFQHIEDQDETVEESQIVQEKVELGAEEPDIEDAENDENAENLEDKEEAQQQTQLNGESQDMEKSQLIEVNNSPEQIETAEEPQHVEDDKTEEVLPITNTLAAEKAQDEEDQKIAEDIQSSEDIKSDEGSKSDELNQSVENMQTLEESKPSNEDSSVIEPQTIKDIPEKTNENDPSESAQAVDDIEIENNAAEEYQTESELSVVAETTVEDVTPVEPAIEIQSLVEENESIDTQPISPTLDVQQSDEAKPLAEESQDLPNALDNENILQNLATVENSQNKEEQDSTAEVQISVEDKETNNLLNNDNNDSEPIKETTSMLTTSIVQAPTNEELTQQQHEEHEQLEEQQATVVESIGSATLKPFVLDSVQNYVNSSYTNQMSSNNNNDNTKQEVKEEDQLFSSKLRRYDGAQVWRIVVQNDRERKLADELQAKYDGQLWKEVKQEVDYLLKPQVLADAEKYVRAANLTRIVLIDNLQTVIEVENPPAEEIAQLQNRKGYRLTWQAYHRLEDIHGYFDYLAKTYPDICSAEIIGYSLEKRPLKILKISNGNANNTGIWIDGGMHAREWISPAVATYVAHQIVEGWDDLPAYMRNINWYIHAVANPDGYEYSHTTDRLWRKNMRSHGRACPGVDLNRNFGYKWGGKGTSANPCSQTYRGSKAFSEPETFYISKFISNFPRETFKGYLSFHSYGQYILYPWGYDYHITKDMADLDLVARQAGTIITKSTGSKFTVGSSATTLYPAAGGSDDWAKGIAGIKYSYTIEMGDTGRYGFVLPADYIEPNGKNGLTVVQTVAKAITMGKNGRRRKLKSYKNH